MIATDERQSAVEVRFGNALGRAAPAEHSGRALLHALASGGVEPLCGDSTSSLLPTFTVWRSAPRGLLNCARCLQLAPTPLRGQRGANPQNATWCYRAGLNHLDIAEDGVSFWLLGHGYLRPRRLPWSDVGSLAPQKYTEQGLSGDKGAGRHLGSACAWRIAFVRPHGRAIPIPVVVPDRYLEARVHAWATMMNVALALPDGDQDQP